MALLVHILAATPAAALSFSTNALIYEGSAYDEDPLGPSSGGTLISQKTLASGLGTALDFSGPAFAKAYADWRGYTSTFADGIFYGGSTDARALVAWAFTSRSVMNTFGTPVPISYTFSLTGPRLTIADYAGVGSTDEFAPAVTYSLIIRRDGLGIWHSDATIKGGQVSHTLTGSGEILGDTFFGSGSVFGFQFDDFATTLDLGILPPGGSLTLDTMMYVRVEAGPYELGGQALFGDPGNLDYPGIKGSLQIIPLPSTLLLFGPALAGLAILRRGYK
jgi:hypothetical protein